MSRLAVCAVGVLVAAQAATLAWELGAFSPADGAPRAQRPAAPYPAANQLTQSGPDLVQQWGAIALARPLFSPDRRPAAVSSVAGRAAVGQHRLSGVLVGPFGRTAIFSSQDGKPVVVHEGDRIDAYAVKSIEAGEVRLLGAEGLLVLQPRLMPLPSGRDADVTPQHSDASSARPANALPRPQ